MRQHDEFDQHSDAPDAVPAGDPIVRREQLLPVGRDEAWEMFGTADGLAEWLADEVELDIRVGAEGVIRWHDGDERLALVEEVAEGRRLVLVWSAPGGPPSLVEMTLDDAAEGGGTHLVIVEVPISVLRAVSTSAIGPADGGPDQGPGSGAPRMAMAVACA